MNNGYFPIDGNLADPPHGGSSACLNSMYTTTQSSSIIPTKYLMFINLKKIVERYKEVRVNVEDMNNVDSLIFELNGKEYKLDFQKLLEDYGIEVKE